MSYFEKAANEILGATERMAAAMEEGASILFTQSSSSSSSSTPIEESAANDDLTIEAEEIMNSSPLNGIADGVLGDIMGAQSGPQTPWEHFEAFRHAINWSEPFLLCLLSFHLLIFCITIYTVTKGGFNSRMALLVLLFILVRSSEYINSYGAEHWESFATQNYFDKNGIFIGLMFSSPLLVDCVIMLCCYMKEASGLLVEVKKMEMDKKKRSETKRRDQKGKEGKSDAANSRGKTNKKKTTKKD